MCVEVVRPQNDCKYTDALDISEPDEGEPDRASHQSAIESRWGYEALDEASQTGALQVTLKAYHVLH